MAGYIGANTSSVTNNQNAAERRKKFTFTANTTVLSGLNFAPEKIHIFHNGIRLVRTTDYTEASDGKSVTLVNAAQAGDEIVAVTFAQDPASNTDFVSASTGGTFSGDVTHESNLTLEGGVFTVQSNTDNTVAIGSRYTASDAQHIELTNDTHSHVGTITQADNGNTWINAAGGKELWLNWASRTNPSSKADLYVGNGNDGTQIFHVDGTNNVVKKPTQVAFMAYHQASDLNYAVGDTLAFPYTLLNRGNHYNTSNSTFTAPVAGDYLFSCNAQANYQSGVAGIPRAYWKVNGSNIANGIHLRGSDNQNTGGDADGLEQRSQTVLLSLSANDTVKVVVGQNRWDIFGANSFMGYLLG